MTNKKDYTHEERQKFVEQAAQEYYAKEIGSPPPLNRDFMKKDRTEKKRRRHLKRYSAIAAAVVLVLLAGTTIKMIMSSDDVAYGDKGILHRIYQSFMGIETDKQDEANPEDYMEGFETKSMDDLDEAIDFCDGQLYVPEYLPKGYELDTLKIEKDGNGSITANYNFEKGKQSLQILEMYTAGDEQVSGSGDGEMIRLKDRILYVREEDVDGKTSVDMYTEDAVCMIGEDITKDEAIRIAKNLKRGN